MDSVFVSAHAIAGVLWMHTPSHRSAPQAGHRTPPTPRTSPHDKQAPREQANDKQANGKAADLALQGVSKPISSSSLVLPETTHCISADSVFCSLRRTMPPLSASIRTVDQARR